MFLSFLLSHISIFVQKTICSVAKFYADLAHQNFFCLVCFPSILVVASTTYYVCTTYYDTFYHGTRFTTVY